MIDLRSDTVTKPTERMRDAMRDAVVGDDILGEDPTVRRLEELGAGIFGKEAGLLVTSGTMANQIAVMAFTERGQEIIVGEETHIYNLEVAALACLCQVQVRTVFVDRGYFDPVEVESAIQKPGIQNAVTGLISLENTYDLNRGYVVTPENTREIVRVAKKYKMPVYLDGARILNAAAAIKKDVKNFVEDVDALQLCLTKGLAAPIGSLLIGSKDFIEKARWIKQRIGGGMRQAGIIAAPGIVAFEDMVGRLSEDHEKALTLAKGLKNIGLGIDLTQVQTNVIHITLEQPDIYAQEFCFKLADFGVKAKPVGLKEVRMITHKDFPENNINKVIKAVESCLREMHKNCKGRVDGY